MTTQESASLAESDAQWNYRLGAKAALGNVVLIPMPFIVYVASPPPSVKDWFILLHNGPLLDLLYLLTNALLIPIYLVQYVALKPVCQSVVMAAFSVRRAAITAYSNRIVGTLGERF